MLLHTLADPTDEQAAFFFIIYFTERAENFLLVLTSYQLPKTCQVSQTCLSVGRMEIITELPQQEMLKDIYYILYHEHYHHQK